MLTTDEIPLSTTAERQAVTTEAGAAPEKDWVIVTRGLKRDYDMGGEIVHAPSVLAVADPELVAGEDDRAATRCQMVKPGSELADPGIAR